MRNDLLNPILGKDPDLVPISNSELQCFKDCKRKWWLAYYRGLRPRMTKASGPLALGTRLHAALEGYYADNLDLVGEYKRLLEIDRSSLMATEQDTTKFDSEGELGRIMLEGYENWLAETGADSGLEIVGAEKKVSTQLMNGKVELRGKLDLRVKRKIDNVRLFLDHKALHVDQHVLTPNGYVRIGDIKVGDVLLAPDGAHTAVTGVYPQGEVDLNRIIFSDHTSVLACDDHLWNVRNQSGRTFTRNTAELRDDLIKNYGYTKQYKWDVPLVGVAALKFDSDDSSLPLDPYALGVWLGDGKRRSMSFCAYEPHIPARVEQRLSSTQRLHSSPDGVSFMISQKLEPIEDELGRSYARSPLLKWMKTVKLWECYSSERFIPEEYKLASPEIRLEVLRGIMDTDGFVRSKNRAVAITLTSERLIDDVAWLVRSLGGYATKQIKSGFGVAHHIDGTKVPGKTVYTVSIRLPQNLCPFTLPAKVEAFNERVRRVEKRKIHRIEREGRGEAVCISVDHPSKLYITDNFVVTHNSVATFESITRTAHMSEQGMMYQLLETLTTADGEERCDGLIYNMLRKVKRTANSKPPFYERLEVHFNTHTMRAFWSRLHGTISEMLRVREQLDKGADHTFVAYPRPTQDCTWKCEFFAVCPMFDDGSAAEELIETYYTQDDPYQRYEQELKVSV